MNRLPKVCFFHYKILNPCIYQPITFANPYSTSVISYSALYKINDHKNHKSLLPHLTYRSYNNYAKALPTNTHSLATMPYIKFDDNPPCNMYKNKSSVDLLKNLLVLELCSFKLLVENANKLVSIFQRVLGKRMCNKLIKSTIFYQFVAGETIEEAVRELRSLENSGVAPFIAVPIEEIPFNPKNRAEWRNKLTQNVHYIMESLELFDANFKDRHTVINFKLSALIPMQAMEEFATKVLPELCETKGFSCYNFDFAKLRELEIFNTTMSEDNKKLIIAGMESLEGISEYARDHRIKILIDSEYSTINRTISFFTKLLMQRFNKDFPTIGATYQCYFKNMADIVKEDVKVCEHNDILFSCKIVRGAYMEWERKLAEKKGILSPICDNHTMTCQTYDGVIKYGLEKISRENGKCHFMVASHNVDSVNLTLKLMKDMGVPFNDARISFAQLYGMCDYLTCFLSHNTGALVYKNIPYGPVDSVIPYLLRRAEENASVFDRLTAEKKYLVSELLARFKGLFGITQSKPTFGSGPSPGIHEHGPSTPTT